MNGPWKSNAEHLAAMRADAAFMAWLVQYLPDWESEYSGNLLAMHDAFKAGQGLRSE